MLKMSRQQIVNVCFTNIEEKILCREGRQVLKNSPCKHWTVNELLLNIRECNGFYFVPLELR